MILLESGNRLLIDLITSFLIPDADYKPAPTEVKLHDFDNATFLIEVSETDLQRVVVSLSLPCYRQIKDHGAEEAIKAAFGSMVQAPRDQYDVTIALTPADYSGKEQEIIEKTARLKRIALSGVFDHFLKPLSTGNASTLTNFKFDLRQDTTVYITPAADRVTISYRLAFIDKADNEIGRVFLNGFCMFSFTFTYFKFFIFFYIFSIICPFPHHHPFSSSSS